MCLVLLFLFKPILFKYAYDMHTYVCMYMCMFRDLAKLQLYSRKLSKSVIIHTLFIKYIESVLKIHSKKTRKCCYKRRPVKCIIMYIYVCNLQFYCSVPKHKKETLIHLTDTNSHCCQHNLLIMICFFGYKQQTLQTCKLQLKLSWILFFCIVIS